MSCKFEIQLVKVNKFHCAVRNGANGWAYLWSHEEKWNDPCIDCPFYTEGMPHSVFFELGPSEFYSVAGMIVLEDDWEKLNKIKGE